MTTNLALASIKAAGALTSRTFAQYFSDVINVKNYGATGDGSTDDTAAIQAAIDAAFGPSASPNGTSNPYANKQVFFPAGNYKVSSPTALTVSGAVSSGGLIKLTVNSTVGFSTGHLCFVTGVGGVTDSGAAVNSNFGIVVNDSTHITLQNTVFGGAYTSGGAVTRAAITLTSVLSGAIIGEGKLSTIISTTTTNGSAIGINGFGYSTMEGIGFKGNGTGVAMDLDWEGSGGTVQSTQSNLFSNVSFGSCAYGARLGQHGQQVSENTFVNCNWDSCTIAGLAIMNYNALQMSVYGGNIQSCAIGIHIAAGSCPIIHGVGFQLSTDTDIDVVNTVGDGMSVHGCRSESQNFLRLHSGASAALAVCTHLNVTAGVFAFVEGGSGVYPGALTVDACFSQSGAFTGNGKLYIRGNQESPSAVSNAANNGSGLIRLTVGSTTGWLTGDFRQVSGVGGTTEANAGWTITVIDATHIDLQTSSFVHAYTSGGQVNGTAFGNVSYLSSFTGRVVQNI